MARHSRGVVAGRWVGTPDDVARLGRLTYDAFEHGDSTNFTMKVRMPGVEHEYATPEEFLDAARDLDLDSVVSVEIWCQHLSTDKDGRVSGTFRKAPTAQSSAS